MRSRLNKKQYCLLFSTTGNQEEASRIASHLVENRLVACVNIIPSIRSIYWWNDQVNDESESLLLMKTEKSKIKQVETAIKSIHSYETPELIAMQLDYGMPDYLSWVSNTVKKDKKK
jgi:periplasmic divalent cation tolerance protein